MKRPLPTDVAAALRGRGLFARVFAREVNLGDRVFRLICAAFGASVVVLLAGMAFQMTQAASASLRRFGAGFLMSGAWDPVQEVYGALPFVWGTIASSLLALAIAVPIAVGTAVVLAELAPGWVRRPLGFCVELLAAIPSVVYGLWGIFVLAPWLRETVQPAVHGALGFLPFFRGHPTGFGLLTGGLILAIMILPTIAAVARDVIQAAPRTLHEGALALGATRWETLRFAVLPTVRSGLVGAVILGLGRALGETMAVTMVIGNRPEITASLFAPAQTMASLIANEYAEASSELHLAALSEIGLLLFGVTLALNLLARLLVWRVGRLPGGVGTT